LACPSSAPRSEPGKSLSALSRIERTPSPAPIDHPTGADPPDTAGCVSVLVVNMLVLVALVIMATAITWAWQQGSLHPSEQELVDVEFERIVAALGRSDR
jgi:hypothetical protein